MDSFLSMVLFFHFTGGNGRCKAPKATFNSFWAVQNGRETSQSCSRHWFVKRNAFFSRMTLKPKKNVSAAPVARKRKEEVFLKGKVPAYLLAILWVVLVRKKGACYNDAVVDFKKPFTLCDQMGKALDKVKTDDAWSLASDRCYPAFILQTWQSIFGLCMGDRRE